MLPKRHTTPPIGRHLVLWLTLFGHISFLLVVLLVRVDAKVVSGDFKLSGVNSEKVLTSFAVRPEFGAVFELKMTASDMYETERYLNLHLYKDEAWGRHLKVMTCAEKIRHATQTIGPVLFDYVNEKWQLQQGSLKGVILTQDQRDKYDPRKVMASKRKAERAASDSGAGDGDKDKNEDEKEDEKEGAPSKMKPKKDNAAAQRLLEQKYVDDVFINLDERDLIAKTQAFTAKRPQYWYLTIDDCVLETTNLDNKVPNIHFELEIQNALQPITSPTIKLKKATHLSADETSLIRLHTITFLISGGISLLLLMTAGLQSAGVTAAKGKTGGSGGGTVHAAVLWVALAAALDAGSSLFEIIHLKAYESNGYGNYFLDAVAAHMEALCDSLIMLLLLSIGAGWTLPSDAVRFHRTNESSVLQHAFADLASPLRSLLSQPLHSMVGILGWGTIALQALLCQWGRTYNDDFESYHDLEHLPGKILMMIRIVLGLLLLAVAMRTSLQARVKQLQSFYQKLAILGFAWFQSLPFVTWMCNTFVPYYLRHPAVFMWSALLQSSSLVLLAWLVTSHSKSSAFAQYSHMVSSSTSGGSLGGAGPPSLTESLSGAGSSGASTFSFGKTKIAID